MIKRIIVALLAGMFVLASCSKDDNDKLEGKWQLRQMEADGVTIEVDTVFYNFQTSLFRYQIYVPETDGMRYQYGYKDLEEENRLVLELTTVDPTYPAEDFLRYTDWKSVKESFIIEKLTGTKLILRREGKRYIFRKF